ncbi:MAG: cupin domain-containing protein [Methylacidiphilales bacterium]|nr:cupin domain-containing protein [Candidatus Methylacidiphilales bacterium]
MKIRSNMRGANPFEPEPPPYPMSGCAGEGTTGCGDGSIDPSVHHLIRPRQQGGGQADAHPVRRLRVHVQAGDGEALHRDRPRRSPFSTERQLSGLPPTRSSEPDRRRGAAGISDGHFLRLDAEAFGRAPRISIDYALMEKTDAAAVVESTFRWSDIGSWDAVFAMSDHDPRGNAAVGDTAIFNSKGCLVHSDHGLTAIDRIENLVVVTTPDAVLVADRSHCEDVKTLVNRLSNRREASEHRRGVRPWGYYDSIDRGMRFQVKRIVVQPGGVLSLQRHLHRAEHWVVVRGTAEVTVGDSVELVQENQSVFIPATSRHRLANPGCIPLEIIEVQTGSYLGEDDIARFDDVYQRA